jgi:hypothetical protein
VPAPTTEDVARLARRIGREAALALIEARGGRTMAVPRQAHAGSVLAEIVGLDAARLLSQDHGGGYLSVPVARDWRVLVLLARGVPRPEICQRLACSEEFIREVVRRNERAGRPGGEPRASPPQPDLFGTPARGG